jgi:6-pyruvoyltetrahydropterin/6-carboxytetrahydropterin synthase
MYTISVTRNFKAYHYLVGGNWGPENDKHAHHYRVEIELAGQKLDRHGYLVDIVDVERVLDEFIRDYGEHILNELPEFTDLNPSIENFTRIICQRFVTVLDAKNVEAVTVKIWENENASASYRQEL